MSETKPLGSYSVFKDMAHEDTFLKHVKIEEVDLKPDYVECNSNGYLEMTNMDIQIDNGNELLRSEEIISKLNKDEPKIYQDEVKQEIDADDRIIPLKEHENRKKFNSEIKTEQIEQSCMDIYIEDDTYLTEISNKKYNQNENIIKGKKRHKINVKSDCKGNLSINDITYECNDCSYKTRRRSSLVRHLRIHTDQKSYLCNVCEFKCSVKSNLTTHIRVKHFQPLTCNYCQYKCVKKSALVMHLRLHTGEKPYKCSQCNYQCAQKSNLTRHLKVHTHDKSYVCTYCDYKCVYKEQLTLHLRRHAGQDSFSCQYCRYECRHSSVLKNHIRKHTGEKQYSCTFCQYRCASKTNLTVHLKVHDCADDVSDKNIVEKPKKKKTFEVNSDSKNGNNKSNIYFCNDCCFKHVKRRNFIKHVKKHTDVKLFSCNYCDYKCIKKPYLKQHLAKHTGEKPFMCTLCDYKCARKEHLTLHLRNHTNEKPFSCNFCQHKFTQKQHLLKHLRKHTGEKPFSCIHCEYRCVSQWNLSVHLRRHTGEKPFICEICDFKCVSSSGLKQHLGTHSGEKLRNVEALKGNTEHNDNGKSETVNILNQKFKIYLCNYCTYRTLNRSNFLKHIKKHIDK